MGRLPGGLVLACALALTAAGNAAAADGADPQPRIVGGEQTTIEDWPWQVALARNDEVDPRGPYFRQTCGGTLVAPTIVLTAAHCVFDEDPEVLAFEPASNFEVFTGRTALSSDQGQAIDVTEYWYAVDAMGTPTFVPQSSPGTDPPLFDEEALHWDVVILQLEAPSTSETIKLAGADELELWEAGRPAYISGWGSIDDGTFPDDLHAAEVEMIDDDICDSPSIYGGQFVQETMLCAGFLTGGVDTCAGDSGGPLVVPINGGDFRLVGDTSWGIGCALESLPGVYGRIADDPMRSPIQAKVFEQISEDIVGSGATADTLGPNTSIDSGPPRKKRNKSAQFRFSTGEPPLPVGLQFQCKLDAGAFEPCSSPLLLKVPTRGFHTFRVRARDVSHNFDPTPASHTWKVKKKRKRRR
jgi:hypothetical protein